MAERHFRMIRVASGDWILPGNDGKTLYRLQRYEESGDAFWTLRGVKQKKIVGWFWAAYEYDRKIASDADLVDDMLEWDHWTCVASTMKTRKEAIESVVR
jgi:hypothetical protein